MSYFFMRCLFLATLLAPVAACPEPTGGCIRNTPDGGNVPADPYVYSDVTASAAASCKPFSKAIRAYGLLMLAGTGGQDVPDNGLRWLAHAVTELFPRGAADPPGQKKILEAMFRFRAGKL